MNSSTKFAMALGVAAQLVSSGAFAEKAKSKEPTDPQGKCFGIVGKGEGECGGKNPATGESWSCAGHNPSADLGWKKMKKSECDAATKHPEATEKKFVAAKK